MKGLELCREFYNQFGVPMLEKSFNEILSLISVGLVGGGSECLGFDDDISTDHDFEPAFCIFLPDEDIIGRSTAFALERAYAALPKEFMGYKRNTVNPVGGNRHGVMRLSDFLTEKTGNPTGKLCGNEWFFVPEQSLLEVTNGELFCDPSGYFTKIRQELSYMPQDIAIKKLAGNLLIMGQAGQYNYPRMLKRDDTAAAQLAVIEFVKSAINTIFILNKSYVPYYKWCFRELTSLPRLSHLGTALESLISTPNDEHSSKEKLLLIDQVSSDIISIIKADNLSDFNGAQLEGHAYSANQKIADSNIRNLHILYGV